MKNSQKNSKDIVQKSQKWVNIRIKAEYVPELREMAEKEERNLTQMLNYIIKKAIEKKD